MLESLSRFYLHASVDVMFAIHHSNLINNLGDINARRVDFIATYIVAFHFSHTQSYQGHRSILLNAILREHTLYTIVRDFIAPQRGLYNMQMVNAN